MYALGVDLGTTHTAAAVAVDDASRIIELGSDRAVVPSVVATADGALLTGDAAARRALDEPASAAREFKRRLGDPTPFLLDGAPYGAETLMGRLLTDVVEHVASEMGEDPVRIALTHPAAYGPFKLDLLRETARIADVDDPVLLTEPEAAATEYVATRELEDGDVVAVYDLGGGTFDISLVRRHLTGFEPVGAPGGLERFGGADLDRAVIGHVRSLAPEIDWSDPSLKRDLARLASECRRAKEALSFDSTATIAVRVGPVVRDIRITRDDLDPMVRPRLDDTLAAAERVLRGAGIDWDGVAVVLLIGGASRMPLIGEWLSAATGRPVTLDAHPKHCVAMGAARTAVAAHRVTDRRPSAEAGEPSGTVPWSEVQAALDQLRGEQR